MDRKLHGGYWSMIYYSTHSEEASKKLEILSRNCNRKKHRERAGVSFLARPYAPGLPPVDDLVGEL